ncbi:hypothetical protein GCG54_00011207 [Colletotrichum gloeosporioides]|uniref:F-box domain-containing protein n=1 Tax=Colletotrichum gloeosporioides TaxID=474922 RepID=A0A8H4FNR4_COLGL|nr:uncharacterized protein GCG54_00011207 [Colletotrichum gloeosporioides]KAF3809013.1 hypothetical protein GCG54_00011207 [Colletotrichum gloeosporioides]
MAKPTLETLPPEILHQIFKLVVAQKDAFTTSLCCTSKRIREFSSAALYGTLTPHEPSGPDELSLPRVVALFHAFALNPRLGELVQEIDLFHLYTWTKWEPIHLQMFRGIYTMWRTLPGLSLPPPQLLNQVQYMVWLSELLITKMPNLHTLAIRSQSWQRYHLLGDEKRNGSEFYNMETLDIVARAAGGRVLFPHLKNVCIDMHDCLKPLSDVAPNIESLELSDVNWDAYEPADIPDINLPHLKFLEIGDDSVVTMRVLPELVRRLPSLRKLHYEHTDSGIYCFEGGPANVCPTPQGIVNLLKPIAEQLKELKLSHFDRWIVRLCHETRVSRYAQKFVEPAGILEPLEFLSVLERLDVDSDCLWVQRHPYVRRSNYEKVMHLIKLLPQRLQHLQFDGLNDDDADGDDPDPRTHHVRVVAIDDGDESMVTTEQRWYSVEYPHVRSNWPRGSYVHEHAHDGLLLLPRHLRQRCPDLQSMTYRFLPKSPGLGPDQLQTLKQAFAEVGIAFHPSGREEYEIEKRYPRGSRWQLDGPEVE